MPMTKAGLSAVIVTKLNAQFGTPADASPQQKFADAVAEAVVTYIQANAVVSATGVVTIPSTSAPGAPSAGTSVDTGTVA